MTLMKVYFAADHAGFALKEVLVPFVRDELHMEVEDCGAHSFVEGDDYPAIMAEAARRLSADAQAGVESRAILIGGSGQGEAIAANRFPRVRAVTYYGSVPKEQQDANGEVLDILVSTRVHNDANALALGARFLTAESAREALRTWLSLDFSHDPRHVRRIAAIDSLV